MDQVQNLVYEFCAKIIISIVSRIYLFDNQVTDKSDSRFNIILSNPNKIFGLLKKHINKSWILYHKNSDQELIINLNNIIKYNIVCHISCLFDYITLIAENMIDLLDYSAKYQVKISDISEIKKLLKKILDIGKKKYPNIKSCNSDCLTYEFIEGEDFCL